MAAKKANVRHEKRLVKIAPGVYSDDPRDLKDAREWARREDSGGRKKRD